MYVYTNVCVCVLLLVVHLTASGLVLSSKISPRAFGGVNSPDALCARHALAVAALAARDMPGMYVEQMSQLVSNSLEIWHTTGGNVLARPFAMNTAKPYRMASCFLLVPLSVLRLLKLLLIINTTYC